MTTEPYIRVDGNVICDNCGEPYWKHPVEKQYDCNDGQEMHLLRGCDGKLMKP